MFCPKCGKEVNDDAAVCVHCGRTIKEEPKQDYNESKTGLGVLFGLFLGLIGLIIGICLYPAETIARQTFMKGWMIAFFTALGIGILSIVIIISIASCAFTNIY